MNFYRYCATLLALLLFSAAGALAQQVKTVPMYEVESSLQIESELPSYEIRRQYINLNSSVAREGFLNTGDRLVLPTEGLPGEFRVDRITRHSGEAWSVIARGTGPEGRYLSFSVKDGRIQGSVHMHDTGELYQLSWDPMRRSNFMAAIDYSELDIVACPGHLEPDAIDPSQLDNFRSDPPDMGQQVVTIDVLIPYTNKAEQWMEDNAGGVDLFIAEVMNRSQMAVDNSEIDINFRLAHAYNTPYDEDTDDNTSTTLSKLQDSDDGFMDNVHNLRDAYGADLVAMIAKVGDVGGIAYVLNSTSGAPAWAFSVNRVQQLGFTFTFAHEMGHNMGSHHSRNQNSSPAPPEGALHEYSTGWRWTGSNGVGYVSVMTYNEGDEETPHFSNPDISYHGAPTGSYDGEHAPADNARSLNGIRGVVADYRDADDDPRPSTPIPNNPQDGETGLPPTPNLAWSMSADAETYTVQVSTSTNFNSPLISQTITGTAYRIQSPLNYLTTYYWRVRASNVAGNSNWSSAYSFTTVIEPPENVTVSSPLDGSFQVDVRPSLQWQQSARAAQYEVQISTKEDFSETVSSSTITGTTLITNEPLQFATIYYWRVRAINEGGTSDWSEPQGFTTVVNETKVNMNYPNPFSGSTTIRYQLAEQTDVLLEIYDPLGRKVRTLVDEQQQPRVYNLQLDASDMASGVYIIRLITGNTSDVLGMTLVK